MYLCYYIILLFFKIWDVYGFGLQNNARLKDEFQRIANTSDQRDYIILTAVNNYDLSLSYLMISEAIKITKVPQILYDS